MNAFQCTTGADICSPGLFPGVIKFNSAGLLSTRQDVEHVSRNEESCAS
jgi:hypothetical protein